MVVPTNCENTDFITQLTRFEQFLNNATFNIENDSSVVALLTKNIFPVFFENENSTFLSNEIESDQNSILSIIVPVGAVSILFISLLSVLASKSP